MVLVQGTKLIVILILLHLLNKIFLRYYAISIYIKLAGLGLNLVMLDH